MGFWSTARQCWVWRRNQLVKRQIAFPSPLPPGRASQMGTEWCFNGKEKGWRSTIIAGTTVLDLDIPALKKRLVHFLFFIVVGQCSSGTGWWVAQPCPQIKIKPEFILHQSRCSQILKLSWKQNSKASLALPFSAPEMFKSISCTSLSAGA